MARGFKLCQSYSKTISYAIPHSNSYTIAIERGEGSVEAIEAEELSQS